MLGSDVSATLWLKRHLVAEEHVGFSKVRNWLPSSLSRIRIREPDPTFLVSEFLDVQLFSQARRRLLAESFLHGTARPGNWPILLTCFPKNVTRGGDSHPGELVSRARAKAATWMERRRPGEVATCSARAGFGIPEVVFTSSFWSRFTKRSSVPKPPHAVAPADCRWLPALSCSLSHPSSFSFCRPLAKEHIRRNRQSRTFLVENVIGEIWSELEEGSVLERPLPLLE